MSDDVKVYGLKELGEAFDLAPQKVERRLMANATRAGGRVFEEGVRRRAPKDSGEMARNVEMKVKVYPGQGRAQAVIGVIYRGIVAAFGRHGHAPGTEDPGVYAKWDEFGRPGRDGHTHQAAQPFMRPTFDADSEAALNAFAERARAQLGDLVK